MSPSSGVLDPRWSGPFAVIQRDILELIARGAALEDTLGRLASGVEALLSESLVSIQVVDGAVLRHVAAPSLPRAFIESIDRMPIAPDLGSCLAAAHSGRPVIISDLSTHPNWDGYAHLATDHNLHACWSTPVRSAGGDVLGTFAVYYRQPMAPPRDALVTVEAATAMAAIAMEHDRAAQALRQSEERFREMADTIDEVFWLQEAATGRVLYVSPAFESMFGLPCAALYADARAAIALALPEYRPAVDAALVSRDRRSAVEFRIRRPDGVIRWVRAKRLPVISPDGEVSRLVGVAHDITDSKELERQFLQAQRVESLGTLAGGMAHDLNNVLTPILMAASSLRAGMTDDARAPLLQSIEDSARRGAALVQQVLSFARGIEGEYRAVRLADIVADVVTLMRDTVARAIEIRTDVPDDLPAVAGDTTQLHQVLLNLVVNARDAMPSGGLITVTASRASRPDRQAPTADGDANAPFVCLSVSDTGTGIPEEIQDRIFDPFFTTKPVGHGSGLGLSTVIGIVRGHDGAVTVESEAGRGTTFRVYLPAAPEPAEARTAQPLVEDQGEGEGNCVLLVDDELAILTVMKIGLERFGYHTLTATSAAESLQLLEERGAAIGFVLMDVMMPDMSGVALARAMKRICPDVPVVAVTGLPTDDLVRQLRAAGVETCLAKPYELREVLELIKEQCR